ECVRRGQSRPRQRMSPEKKWAIITGASSGIGRALAFQFASGGFNVVITGRNEAALRAVAAECSKKYGADADVLIADLSDPQATDGLIRSILAKSRDYEVLVNNAGFGIHGDFASTDLAENVQLVEVQITSALQLTKAVLPSMITRRSGRILN